MKTTNSRVVKSYEVYEVKFDQSDKLTTVY